MVSLSDFETYIATLLGNDNAHRLVEALTLTEPVVSVRRNRRKTTAFADGVGSPVSWCDEGIYLDTRPAFTFDPMLHAGAYYVQDASSMVYELIVKTLRNRLANTESINYLDLCAAPGGKTTAAIDALSDSDIIMANEIIGSRAKILVENIDKWGAENCIVANTDSARIASSITDIFHIVAVDAPCSGEGMMRKDSDAVAQWSTALITQCASRQREIVDNAWQVLMPGGYLIYSTCTFNREENESIVEYIIEQYSAESIDINLLQFPGISAGISTSAHCYRFMPHLTKGEGLFVAVLQKPGDITPVALPRSKKVRHSSITDYLSSQVKTMQRAERYDALSTVDVDYPTAISFLRGECITLPDDTPRGITAITYQGVKIGYVKNIGNRANNLYPKEWRIRSTYSPDAPPRIVLP